MSGSHDLAAEIAELGPWFHNLHLPDGTQTVPDHPLGDFPASKWAGFCDSLPADLGGWSALDVGCNAGFYCFELARRGATVTGIDASEHYLRQARWAARQFGLEHRVRLEHRSVYEIAHTPETYDLVLFLGVFYHLRYPLLGLDIVAQKVQQLMVFQSLMTSDAAVHPRAAEDLGFADRAELDAPGWPKLAFIETTFCRDPTNWWVPNHAGVLALLRAAGLRVTARPAPEIYLCTPDPDPAAAWGRSELGSALGRRT